MFSGSIKESFEGSPASHYAVSIMFRAGWRVSDSKQFVKNTVREQEQVPASRFRVQFINRQAANKTLKKLSLQNEKQKRIPCSLSHLIPRPPRTVRVVSFQFLVWLVVFLVVN